MIIEPERRIIFFFHAKFYNCIQTLPMDDHLLRYRSHKITQELMHMKCVHNFLILSKSQIIDWVLCFKLLDSFSALTAPISQVMIA